MPMFTTHRDTLRDNERLRAELAEAEAENEDLRRSLTLRTAERDAARSELAEIAARVTVEYADNRPDTEHPDRASAMGAARAALYRDGVDARIESPAGDLWIASRNSGFGVGVRPRVRVAFE